MKQLIKSSFKNINDMLGSEFYKKGHMFTYAGRYGSYKNSLLLSECLHALKSGKRVLYVSGNSVGDMLSLLFRIDNYNSSNIYGAFPTKELMQLSKTCENLMVLSSYDTKVSELFRTIESFKPEVLIMEEYDYFTLDKEFTSKLKNLRKDSMSNPAIKNEFYSQVRGYSMDLEFPVLLGVHLVEGFDDGGMHLNISLSFMSDFIVEIDQNASKIKCKKNRWNLVDGLDAKMKFGNDGILRDA